MKLTNSLDADIKGITRYFEKMFELLQAARAEDSVAPIEVQDMYADESQLTYHRFSHHIKPDMVSNVFSLVEWWMRKVCEHHRLQKNLPLSYRDIKGNNNLDAWHKYLTVYVGLDLTSVNSSYKKLDNLRKVRNQFIHGGGHVPPDKEKEFAAISGISLSMLLIGIEDRFIWDSLDHTKKYIWAAIVA